MITILIAFVIVNVGIFIVLIHITVISKEMLRGVLRLKLREELRGPQRRVERTAPG